MTEMGWCLINQRDDAATTVYSTNYRELEERRYSAIDAKWWVVVYILQFWRAPVRSYSTLQGRSQPCYLSSHTYSLGDRSEDFWRHTVCTGYTSVNPGMNVKLFASVRITNRKTVIQE